MQDNATSVPLSLVVLQTVLFVVLAFAGVGLFIRRSWREALERLGLGKIRWLDLAVSGAAVVAMLAVNFTIVGIWLMVAREQAEAIGEISDALLGDFDSLIEIFLLSVLAGVGEEVIFRGAVQPRLGLLATSVVFASTHLQYSISPATLAILLIGVILGLLRRYFNTWTAILAHFGYNFSLLLLGLLAQRFLDLLG